MSVTGSAGALVELTVVVTAAVLSAADSACPGRGGALESSSISDFSMYEAMIFLAASSDTIMLERDGWANA